MLKDTVSKIEASIKNIKSIRADQKKQLIELLSSLKSEIEGISKTHEDHARSIAGFTELAAHEATRKEKVPGLNELSLEGLRVSVKGFEASHPKLVEIVNELCRLLSTIGV